MAKHEFIAGDAVWPRLRELGRRARGSKQVASAYLGDGAGDFVSLDEGDTLLVALSEANAKNGSVCPGEVRRLMERGVRVFVDPHLHAKVYLLGDVVAVGSPNLSSRSVLQHHETLLVSADRTAVERVRAWFHGVCNTPATPEWVRMCEQVYRPPRGGVPRRRDVEGRLWLVGVSEMEFPEGEGEEREGGEVEAKRFLNEEYQVETLRFPNHSLFAREVKRGDLVIQVWNHGGRRRAYPQGRVLNTAPMVSERGAQIVYVYIEMPIEQRTIGWVAFKRGMAKVGLQLGKTVNARELKGAEIAKAKALVR